MMNSNNHISHTEKVDYPTVNAMEQAALLKARCAMGRWRCSDQLFTTGGGAACSGAREEWYAQLEQRLYEWIGNGGIAQDEPHAAANCAYGSGAGVMADMPALQSTGD